MIARVLRLAALALALALPAAAQAAPPVGGPAGGRPHLLSPSLTPAGGPRLPRGLLATVHGPGGRLAALSRTRIVLFHHGRVVRRLPARGATSLFWPTRGRLLALAFNAAGNEVLRAIAVPGGHVRRATEVGDRLDIETAGRRLRILVRGAHGLRVDTYDARGRRRARFAIPLGSGVTPGFATGDMEGRLVVVSETTGAVAPYTHSLVRLGGSSRPVALAGAVYAFAGPSILSESGGHLARIDRSTRTVTREITVAEAQRATPFAGGVVLGLGRQVYDRKLDLVADNPSAPSPASAPVVRGNRLYALTVRCPASGPVRGAVAVTARTGVVRARRSGAFTLGPLGGAMSLPAEDGCD